MGTRFPSWLLVLIASALATQPCLALDDVFSTTRPAKTAPEEAYSGGGRVGGDTIQDATVIPAIPYSDAGNTCGFANDYDAVCPYAGSTAPDVVYSFLATTSMTIGVDLCASGYDTKVYVWEDTPGNLVGCSDDFCGTTGYQSLIAYLNLSAGHTYYFVVDGYNAECGDYTLYLGDILPCEVTCPEGAQIEGEPPCQDGYVDTYNDGCQLGGWVPILPQTGDCGVMCGRACTYMAQGGLSYRDSDWYSTAAAGGQVRVTCTAEFPVQLILIYGIDCANLQYDLIQGDACEPVTLTRDFEPNTEFWVWVGPSVFSGVPESTYRLELCGIGPSTLGACCTPQSRCYIATESRCEITYHGTWLGGGTDCDPYPCVPDPPGACCLTDGSCQVIPGSACSQQGGLFVGAGTNCDPEACLPFPVDPSSWGRIKVRYRDQ